MTQYNSFNVKISNSELNKLKSTIKYQTVADLRLSSNMIGNSNDETNFLRKSLLTNSQVVNLRKAFANNSLSDIKLSKTHLSKTIQSEGFLGKLLGPLLKTVSPLMKNVIKPLAKSVLIPLGLTAAAVAAAAEYTKFLGSGTATLIISNDEMEDIMKIVKPLEDSGLLLKDVSETIQKNAKEQNAAFLSMLLGTLSASLLGNMLTGKRNYKSRLCL